MPRLYVDGRCLQDPAFARRGVGLHTAAVLRHARGHLPRPVELIAVLDDSLPPLGDDLAALFDHLQHSRSPRPTRRPAVFLQPSPLTHDPAALAPFLGRPDVVSCAIVYDFIPLEEPRYLPTPQARRRYLAGLYWLKLHHLHYPISRSSADRLRDLVGVPADRVAVTGASVRDVFARFAGPTAPLPTRFPVGGYFLLVGGNDERKNQACALTAHARFRAQTGSPVGLVLVGHHDAAYRQRLEKHYQDHGGAADAVEYLSDLDDAALATLYHHARAVVCPSRLEGFSLPVVEAVACGCPVLAANNAAHLELVRQPDALFAPDDAATLAGQLARFTEPGTRADLLARQRDVPGRFAEAAVAGRLWAHVARHLDAGPRVRPADAHKPRLAVLSPYPPERSGVADYTARTLQSLAPLARVDVFTDAAAPRRDPWVAAFHPISDLAYLQGGYDRVVAVAGNSHFHWRIHQLHQRYGGPVLMHDTRLAELYAWRDGLRGLIQRATKLLGREVPPKEAAGWLANPSLIPVLFLDDLLVRADPFMVHSRVLQAEVARRYGVEPAHLPFCCYRHFQPDELTHEMRAAARQRLGVSPDRILIITLGIVTMSKGPHECVYALEQLRTWGVPAELHFVGATGDLGPELRQVVDRVRVADRVRFLDDWISDETYRDYLLAADYAIQLRSIGNGALSGAVLDCISAGLPTVCNDDLARAMEAPGYVLRVPDNFSPLLIAEEIFLAWREARHADRLRPARDVYVRDHSFDRYSRRLLQVLGLAG